MKQRWTFRCYPTPEQEEHFARTFGCCRYVWNWALRLRSDGYRAGERIGYPETDKRLTLLKREPEYVWLNEISSVPLQQALRDLQVAFSNFFDKRTGYPAFKRKDGQQSANYSERGFSFDPATRSLKLAKSGLLKVKWSRGKIPEPSSVRLIRKPSGRYFISLVVNNAVTPLPQTGKSVGIDFGLIRLATLSNGEHIANPRHLRKRQKRLAMLQRRLARKKKGSARRQRAKLAVARIHEKIADCRKDALHKLTTRLVREYDIICIEDLNLRGMVKNHSLARSLSDAAIGMAVRMLDEKTERYGKTSVKVDRWLPSTKLCSCCGHRLSELPLSAREWTCPECGAFHDRDENAANNIEAAGLAVLAHGDGVRAIRPSGRKAARPRSANQQGAKLYA